MGHLPNLFISNKRDSNIIIPEENNKNKYKDNSSEKKYIEKEILENNEDNSYKEKNNLTNNNNMDKNDIKNEEEDYKIINLFEFQQKTNTVEYFLNLSLKNKKSLTIKETKQLNFTNNNGNISFPSPKEISEKKYLTEPKDQPPFNITEYKMPLNDINKISKILNSNTLFQNENQNIVELIVTEIMYLVIPKDTIIYDTNDISNFFYIINK